MTLRIDCADGRDRERAVSVAKAGLRRGDLVLLPTEAVYGIAADAFSERGVGALRAAKSYDEWQPLPVLVGARSTLNGIAAGVDHRAQALIRAFWPGSLTVILPAQPTLAWGLPTGQPISVRMPLHPVALAVLQATGPLVVTTANAPGLPAPADVDDALTQLGDIAIALDAGDLTDDEALPSTVVDLTGDVARVVREGALTVADIERICPVEVDRPRPSGA